MYKNYVKRNIDLFIAALLLIVLSPIFIITYIILNLTSDTSPFFTQLRPGKK